MIRSVGISERTRMPGFPAILTVACFLLLCGATRARHPIHVSVTEIEYDQPERELEIMIRIFIDDLENAVRRHRNEPSLDILNPDKITTEKLISAYLEDHFSVALDNKRQRIEYLGQEEEGQALICYVLVSVIRNWQTCEVTNTILQELYDDQSNIVHVTVNGKTKSRRLVRDNPKGLFSFGD